MARRLLLVLMLPLLAAVSIPAGAVAVREPRQAFAFPSEDQDCPCITLRTCPSLLALLKEQSKENIQKLRSSICGFHNREPKVTCCREPPTTTTTTTTTTVPTTTTTTTVPTTTPKTPSPLEDPRLLSICGKHRTPDRIFNGEEADFGEYPWIAALGYIEKGFPNKPLKFQCGGSLITDRYIVTAAHCIRDAQSFNLSVVRLGEHTLSTDRDCKQLKNGQEFCNKPHKDYNVEEVIVHPGYDSSTVANDIALIRVDRKIEYGVHINPVCLPRANLRAAVLADGKTPEVAGWGYTEKGYTSDKLLRVEIPLADLKQCNESTARGTLKETQLCAGGKDGKDSCQGDSGGPLVVSTKDGPPYRLIGLTSYGISCGQDGYPGVYTSVSHYKDWIVGNVLP